MRTYTAICVLTLTLNIYAQADLAIHFLMYDNATPPNNGSWELIFGLDSTATDGIDVHLGEYPIPPDVCCGWGGPILCAAFILPNDPNGVWIDYRFGELPYTGVKQHRIWYCSDTSSTVVTIQCNFPPGVSAVLKDLFGGIFINISMVDSNQYYIPDPYIGLGLMLTLNYDNVVPVEFKSFTGVFSNSSVRLNWVTETETNNSGFEILRFNQNNNTWNNIGFVPGSGTTIDPVLYSFTDNNVSTGTYIYRLKQIDYDGTAAYSDKIIVEVYFPPEEYIIYQNHPNPFNPVTTIIYSIPEYSEVIIKIFDLLGNEIETLVNERKSAGKYELIWNAADLSGGVYFCRLQSGGYIQTKKMVLIK